MNKRAVFVWLFKDKSRGEKTPQQFNRQPFTHLCSDVIKFILLITWAGVWCAQMWVGILPLQGGY